MLISVHHCGCRNNLSSIDYLLAKGADIGKTGIQRKKTPSLSMKKLFLFYVHILFFLFFGSEVNEIWDCIWKNTCPKQAQSVWRNVLVSECTTICLFEITPKFRSGKLGEETDICSFRQFTPFLWQHFVVALTSVISDAFSICCECGPSIHERKRNEKLCMWVYIYIYTHIFDVKNPRDPCQLL